MRADTSALLQSKGVKRKHKESSSKSKKSKHRKVRPANGGCIDLLAWATAEPEVCSCVQEKKLSKDKKHKHKSKRRKHDSTSSSE